MSSVAKSIRKGEVDPIVYQDNWDAPTDTSEREKSELNWELAMVEFNRSQTMAAVTELTENVG
jgi:hypothetical protein